MTKTISMTSKPHSMPASAFRGRLRSGGWLIAALLIPRAVARAEEWKEALNTALIPEYEAKQLSISGAQYGPLLEASGDGVQVGSGNNTMYRRQSQTRNVYAAGKLDVTLNYQDGVFAVSAMEGGETGIRQYIGPSGRGFLAKDASPSRQINARSQVCLTRISRFCSARDFMPDTAVSSMPPHSHRPMRSAP